MGMNTRHRLLLGVALLVALAGCASDPETNAPRTSAPTVQDVTELIEEFVALEPGSYFIDPDADPSTPLRVVYEVPADGWSSWIGAAKFAHEGHVGVSITAVTNLVRQGCRNHRPADPPIGSSVDDLATALADLAPFRVTSLPKDVTVYGYSGKHLELTVPEMPTDDEGFTECVGHDLASWISAPFGSPGDDLFFGHTGPGYSEELWILDVEGTRLMIAAERSPGSPPEDLAEQRAILDSIRIEP
jgi:hypothetical protein